VPDAKRASVAVTPPAMMTPHALLDEPGGDEYMEFDTREFEKIVGRQLDDDVIQTPDGRTLWRIWLVGEKAEARKGQTTPRLMKGSA